MSSSGYGILVDVLELASRQILLERRRNNFRFQSLNSRTYCRHLQTSDSRQSCEVDAGRTNIFKISFLRELAEASITRFPASLLKAGVGSACAQTCWRVVVAIEKSKESRPLFVTPHHGVTCASFAAPLYCGCCSLTCTKTVAALAFAFSDAVQN